MLIKDAIHEFNTTEQEDRPEASLYVDGHVDLPYHMMKHAGESKLSELKDAPFTLIKARKSGIRLFCTALFCDDKFNGERSVENFKGIYEFVQQSFDQIMILKNPGDMKELKEGHGLVGTILLLENADFLSGAPAYIEELKKMGIAIVGLTHAGKNRLADGNSVAYPDGITRKGRDIINRLNHENIILDVAHLHEKCFWQLLRLVENAMISSHTGIREVFEIPRNIYLEQAREIIQRGGMVGITFNPEMLAGPGRFGIERMFEHVDTYVQRFGPDAIGIGSDFCGFDETLIDAEDITGVEKLIEIMLSAGYGREAVNQIMGGNWIRFFEKHLWV
jgi:membrane dipeptidase